MASYSLPQYDKVGYRCHSVEITPDRLCSKNVVRVVIRMNNYLQWITFSIWFIALFLSKSLPPIQCGITHYWDQTWFFMH